MNTCKCVLRQRVWVDCCETSTMYINNSITDRFRPTRVVVGLIVVFNVKTGLSTSIHNDEQTQLNGAVL